MPGSGVLDDLHGHAAVFLVDDESIEAPAHPTWASGDDDLLSDRLAASPTMTAGTDALQLEKSPTCLGERLLEAPGLGVVQLV